MEAIGWFAVLRNDLEFCLKEDIIHFRKKHPKGENISDNPSAFADSRKVAIVEIMGKIDDELCRWFGSLKSHDHIRP